MELISSFDPMDPNILPTFSFCDISSMVLQGPFCSNCMNLKKWKISQLNSRGKLLLYQHLIGENVGRELCDLQLLNDSIRPFTFSKPLEGFLPLPCSEITCNGNKAVNWYHKPLAFTKVIDNAVKESELTKEAEISKEVNPVVPKCSIQSQDSVKKSDVQKESMEILKPIVNNELKIPKAATQDIEKPEKLADKGAGDQNIQESREQFSTKPSEVGIILESTAQNSKPTVNPKTYTQPAPSAKVCNYTVPPPTIVATNNFPFFYPSVAVKKPLCITTDLHLQFEQITTDHKFPMFVKLVGEKFPKFCKSITTVPPLIKCSVCIKSFNTLHTLVLHSLSRTHIVNMHNFGYVFDVKDFAVIWSIYKEATAIVPNEEPEPVNTASNKVAICPAQTKKPFVSQSEFNTTAQKTQLPLTKSIGSISSICGKPTTAKMSSIELYNLPFTKGSGIIGSAYPVKDLSAMLVVFRKRLASISTDVIEIVLESMYRLPENSKCLKCNETLALSEWIAHLINTEHVQKLTQCGKHTKWITHWDVKRMDELLKDCEMKAAEFPSLQKALKDKSVKSASSVTSTVQYKTHTQSRRGIPQKAENTASTPSPSAAASKANKITPAPTKKHFSESSV